MPQRFLKPGITNSDAWNACSFPAQSLYIRLLTLVDDFGRYDGRLPILHCHCFALRSDVTPQETAGMRDELHNAGLITVYEVDGKDYIQFAKWTERTRSDKSKYPDPPQDSAGFRREKTPPSSPFIVHRSSSPPLAKPKPSAKPAKPAQSDSEWLAGLVSDPAYEGIPIQAEHGKMIRWCEVNKKQPTRRRFINWLNRADKPMKAASGNHSATNNPLLQTATR